MQSCPTKVDRVLELAEKGIYCASGDFYIDPLTPGVQLTRRLLRTLTWIMPGRDRSTT